MSNIAIVFTANLGPWAFEKLPDGKDSVTKVLEFASRLPESRETVLFTSPGQKFSGKHRLIAKENWTPEQLITEIRALCPKKGNAFFMFADSPLLNDVITGRMYENHTKYLAQYTFAGNDIIQER